MVLVLIGTGLAKSTSCQPEAVSPVKVAEARRVALAIQVENPLYITAVVIKKFMQRIEKAGRRRR